MTPGYRIRTLITSSALCLFFFTSLTSSAQKEEEDSPKSFEHQAGINATNFIQSLINFGGNNLPGTPYQIQYKFFYNLPNGGLVQSVGFRAGAGYSKTGSKTERPLNNTRTEFRMNATDLRFGLEAQKMLSPRWTLFAGIDYVNTITKNYSFNSFLSGGTLFVTETNEDAKSHGWGPVFGFQFNISRHLALGTELSVYSRKGKSDAITTSSSQGTLPQIQKSEFTNSQITLPTFFYFIARF